MTDTAPLPAYDDQNIFARILRGELPCEKLYEDDNVLVIMDIMPRGDGHCLVLPKTACRNIFDIESSALAAVAQTTQLMAHACRKAFNCDGITIQQFNESAGGQVVFHLHTHIIPRFEGISMKPHTGKMEDADVLAANAEKIRAALASL